MKRHNSVRRKDGDFICECPKCFCVGSQQCNKKQCKCCIFYYHAITYTLTGRLQLTESRTHIKKGDIL